MAEISSWLERSARRDRKVEVAFYGGSFTGLPLERQQQLLAAVAPFIKAGQVDSIRLSTRPDYITPATPSFLQEFGVGTVELGVQSMDQDVLNQNLRGHDVQQVVAAVSILKGAGLATGVQLMLGLPGETTSSAVFGAQRLADLQPDFARLYPTLILKGSGLEILYRQGRYRPLSLLRAVALTARIMAIFACRGVMVIRTGLQPSGELETNLVAGPYHPAFGELVKGRLFFQEVRRKLASWPGGSCRVTIAARDRSLLVGPQRSSLKRLQGLHLLEKATFAFVDSEEHRGRVTIEEEGAITPGP